MDKFKSCCLSVKNADWDNYLAYRTVKLAQIRDRYLGGLHYLLILGIFIYIIIAVILVQQGYLGFDVPIGSIRFELIPYTTEGNVISTTTFPYCTQYTGPSPVSNQEFCKFYATESLLYPSDLTNSFLVGTMFTDEYQTRNPNCEEDSTACQGTIWFSGSSGNYYSTAIEDYQVQITHSAVAPNFVLSSSSDDTRFEGQSLSMQGFFQYANGTTLTLNKGIPDVFTVNQLLLAAIDGEELDTFSDVTGETNSTFRQVGMVLNIEISYSNTYDFIAPANALQYTYQTRRIVETDYNIKEIVNGTDASRVLRTHNGVRINIQQSGSIGEFQFQAMLVQMVSGMGLLAVATIVVDQLAIRVLPQRAVYRSHKYQDVGDRTDLKLENNLMNINTNLKELEKNIEDLEDLSKSDGSKEERDSRL